MTTSYSTSTTIFAQFDNQELKIQLEKCATEMHCKIFWGETSSPDIVAVPYFISIIDRNIVGIEAWKIYLEYKKEVKDDTPCIIIDNTKSLKPPAKSNVHHYSIDDKNSIPQIISTVKEVKNFMKGDAYAQA
jgi:hypothetical protein